MLRSSSSTLLKHATNNKNSIIIANNTTQSRNIAFVSSRNSDEARRNVVRLYRRWLQIIPWMKDVYHVPTEQQFMIQRLRREFTQNAKVTETHLVDALVYRGYQDYEEVEMHHKQRGHILKFFSEDEPAMMNPTAARTTSVGRADVTAGLPAHIVDYLKDNPEALEQIKKMMHK
jgi:hypothetical protein